MLGYLLAALVVAAVLWWLWRVLRVFFSPAVRSTDLFVARRSFTYTRTRCPVCGDLLTGLEIAAIREGRRGCEWAACPYKGRRW